MLLTYFYVFIKKKQVSKLSNLRQYQFGLIEKVQTTYKIGVKVYN